MILDFGGVMMEDALIALLSGMVEGTAVMAPTKMLK